MINFCKALNELTFDKNSFSLIPESIENITSLKILSLTFVDNDVFHESITEIKKLVVLDLQGSGIKKLPRSISKLRKLKKLNLNWCKNLKNDLEKLPSIFNSLEKLEAVQFNEIDLSDAQKEYLTQNTNSRIKLTI